MSVLLLRLAGPMQSWGIQSDFAVREAGREPSKSGVVGLICAALGRPRDASLADLISLRMAVRVDREGHTERDFQTSQDRVRADGRSDAQSETRLSQRFFLADADYLVGLEGDEAKLREIESALLAPVWPVFLGRKAFVPGRPITLRNAIVDRPLEAAIAEHPWQARDEFDEPPDRLRVVIDATFGETTEVRQDLPLNFAKREFSLRYVRTFFLPDDALGLVSPERVVAFPGTQPCLI